MLLTKKNYDLDSKRGKRQIISLLEDYLVLKKSQNYIKKNLMIAKNALLILNVFFTICSKSIYI